MSRILTMGLLATAALAMAMPAAAQREDRGGGRGEWSRGSRGGADGGAAGRMERQARPASQARPAPTVRNAPVPPSNTNGDWSQRRPSRVDQPGSSGRQADGRWNGNRGGNPPVATPAPAAPQPVARPDRDGQGNGFRGEGNRPDRNWNRGNDGVRGDGNNRPDRNWNRGNDRNNDGNDRWQNNRDNDRARNDNRWNNGNRNDWNRQREWSSQRRLQDRERWSDTRRWDNGWRNDRRYDWNNYRTRYRSVYHMPSYRAPFGWNSGYQRFSVGIFLSNILISSNYWLDDPYRYRLPPAYGALRWVRYYDDAMLVDTRDGYVVDVIHDFFW